MRDHLYSSTILMQYNATFNGAYDIKEYGVGYVIENGIKRPLTPDEKAVQDKHLLKSLSECNEVARKINQP